MNFPLPYAIHPGKRLQECGIMQEIFKEEDVAAIKEMKKELHFEEAKTSYIGEMGIESDFGEAPADHVERSRKRRVCESAHVPVNESNLWLWNRVAFAVARGNYDMFLHDISHIEGINYLQYEGNGESKYDIHIDTYHGDYRKWNRKISGILMLSDPSEYEGGVLEVDLAADGNLIPQELGSGDLILFDSERLHRVTSVTKGRREVLVFWVLGDHKL